jgi:hypothetical protein
MSQARPDNRGLYSFTSELNLSTSGHIHGLSSAVVELKCERVQTPAQCWPTPGVTTSMTRRAELRGQVRGSDRATPRGVPLSGGMHGSLM